MAVASTQFQRMWSFVAVFGLAVADQIKIHLHVGVLEA
jgi:hypothetical protein